MVGKKKSDRQKGSEIARKTDKPRKTNLSNDLLDGFFIQSFCHYCCEGTTEEKKQRSRV